MRTVIAAVLAVCAAAAAEVPAASELHVRLKTKVSSAASKPGERVEAVLIAPVLSGGTIAIPAGAGVAGEVKEAKPSKGPEDRAHLRIAFTEVRAGGKLFSLPLRLKDVDNAREIVEKDGKILGIVGSQTISARIDQGIGMVAESSPDLALLLGVAKAAVM
jgi:hypothetical protein